MILKPLFESCISLKFLALYFDYTDIHIHGNNFDKTKVTQPIHSSSASKSSIESIISFRNHRSTRRGLSLISLVGLY